MLGVRGGEAWGQAQDSHQGTSEEGGWSLRGRDSEICHLKQTQSEKEEEFFVILTLDRSSLSGAVIVLYYNTCRRERQKEGRRERAPLAYNSRASVLTALPGSRPSVLFLCPAPLPCGPERARRGKTAETQTSEAWAEKATLSHHASRCARPVPHCRAGVDP